MLGSTFERYSIRLVHNLGSGMWLVCVTRSWLKIFFIRGPVKMMEKLINDRVVAQCDVKMHRTMLFFRWFWFH
jgi:hypothetical protein